MKPEHNAKPEHNKDGKANDKPGAVAGSEDVEEDGSDEESEEESEGETDSDEYTTGTESSGSHSEHSASDKEVSWFCICETQSCIYQYAYSLNCSLYIP